MSLAGRSFSYIRRRPRPGPLSCPPLFCMRLISTAAAKRILGLDTSTTPTVQELRSAYFGLAKTTHPDVQQRFHDNENDAVDPAAAFRQLTVAYEHLLHGGHAKDVDSFRITVDEEDEYRRACELVLGIKAEIVEESKTNPMFRHWLDGNTDGAQHWRMFFAVHGGLAQKLRPPAGYLEESSSSSSSSAPRRQRRKR